MRNSHDTLQPLLKQQTIHSVGGLKIKPSTLVFLGWLEITSAFLVSNRNLIIFIIILIPLLSNVC